MMKSFSRGAVQARLMGLIALIVCFVGLLGLSAPSNAGKPDCGSSDIEQIDSCLLGKTIKEAIRQLKIDTSQFYTFDEPMAVIRGLYVHLSDTCGIRLLVDGTYIKDKMNSLPHGKMKYLFIVNKKIKGITWEKYHKQKKRSIGLISRWEFVE